MGTRLFVVMSLVLVGTVQPVRAQLRAELIASGLVLPVGFAQDPSQPNVQVVLQQGGRVRVLQNGVLLAQDYLDLTSQIASGGERGLLGLAFAPDYATSGRVYVNFTNPSGDTVVARFLRHPTDPLRADPTTRFDLVWPGGAAAIHQPYANHNGGHLAFGPDGYLYIGLGDGGAGDDPFHYAQTPGSLLGKMLRIDVSVSASHPTGYVVPPSNPFVGQAGVLGEIWDFGLRNPWRYSFDDPARGGTGALIVADVGQAAWEEINYAPLGRGGRNYGWRNREGAHDNVVSLPPYSLPLTDPVYEYSHAVGSAITGGFVYRGSALGAAFRGRYFFADLITNRVWSLALSIGANGEATAAGIQEHTADLGSGAGVVSSFGVDAGGELYLVSYAGAVYRIALAASPPAGAACAGADPFAALGGGTCCDGGWLPPGMVCRVTSSPAPSPPPPPPSVGVCTAPDPFAVLGGGTCCNGGWLPPGMVCSVAPVTPAPPSPPPPPPTPPAPPAGGSCTTADPFAALGGGTCCGGGWLPPGMVCSVAPSTPATPPPPPPTGACTTADPFTALGGGTCCNGGWLPPGMVCRTPAPGPELVACLALSAGLPGFDDHDAVWRRFEVAGVERQ